MDNLRPRLTAAKKRRICRDALNAIVHECIAVNEAPLRAALPQFFH